MTEARVHMGNHRSWWGSEDRGLVIGEFVAYLDDLWARAPSPYLLPRYTCLSNCLCLLDGLLFSPK